MASLSFTSAVSMRPVLAAKATKTIVSTKANALGGGGPNIPAADYKKKMEEKNKLIAANKAKAGAKKAAPTPAPAAKKVAAPAAKNVVVAKKPVATPAKPSLFAKKPVVKKLEAKKVAPAKVSAGFALPVAPKGAYTIAGKK